MSRDKIATYGAAILLVIACILAYVPAFDGPFLSDDVEIVLQNHRLETASGLGKIWTEIPGPQGFYYPLTYTTYWIEHQFWGVQPRGYHVVNILLHALNAIVLWRVLRRLEIGGAWFAAAIFALHPVQAESVAWVTERRNVLSTLFLLITIWSYLESERNARWKLATLMSFLAALLSKTVTLVLPPAILLLTWWKKGKVERSDLVRLAPMFALGMAAGLLTVYTEHSLVEKIGGAWLDRGMGERLALAGSLVWTYAGTLAWPAKLAFVYPRAAIDAASPVSWLPALALLALLAILAFWSKRVGRAPLTASLWFMGTLLPVLGLASYFYLIYSDAADRFLYLPSIGLIALVTGSLAMAVAKRDARARRAMVAAGVVVLALLFVLTFQRSRLFASPEALYADAVGKFPGSWGAQLSLGSILVLQGRPEEAIPHLEASRRLQPTVPGASAYLATAYARVGRTQEALAMFDDALRLAPGDLFSRANLALTLAHMGRNEDAAAQLRRVLEINPDYTGARDALLSVLLRMMAARSRAGQLDEAVRLAREAAALAETMGASDLRARLDAFIRNGGTM